jgi:hypothetical protein
METNSIQTFKGCYIMQQEDIGRFANTLADGFSQYGLFKYICNGKYSHSKMETFWAVSLTLLDKDAICIADSKEANSVLIYIGPQSKEPGLMEYIKAGGIKMLFKLGIRSAVKLLKFDIKAQEAAKKYKNGNCGYLMAFATRLNKQGQHYGKPLMNALLQHLNSSGEECYLETLKDGNVDLYKHFSFELMEQMPLGYGGLTLYAMSRHRKEEQRNY